MSTALHSWLSQAQENTRYDSVTAKYGLVVDTPSGMTQTGQNALRFLRSLSEHSPTFFEGQAKLLSPCTPDLVPDRPASPPSALATPMSGPQRTRRSGRASRSPYGAFTLNSEPESDALFAFDMPSDDPIFLPSPPTTHASLLTARRPPSASRARPYPVCRAYTSPTSPGAGVGAEGMGAASLGSYFPPAPDPSPALDMGMFNPGWDKPYPGAIPTPNSHQFGYTESPGQSASSFTSSFASPQSYASPTTFQSQMAFSPPPHHPHQHHHQHHHQQQSFSQHPHPSMNSHPLGAHVPHPPSPTHTELDMQLGDDADRARMSALMYGSMRVRAVVAASEGDGQGW